jgi:uncharacterized membrane-anchored protein
VIARKHWPFLALVVVLALVPIGIVAWKELELGGSRHVLLRVQPVDPQDLFRGEYVALSYPISRLQHADARPGDRVWVPLNRQPGGAWAGSRALVEEPDDGTFIRGRMGVGGTIEYGIESFFVEDTTAPRYERAVARGRLYAKVALDDNGDATLRELIVR